MGSWSGIGVSTILPSHLSQAQFDFSANAIIFQTLWQSLLLNDNIDTTHQTYLGSINMLLTMCPRSWLKTTSPFMVLSVMYTICEGLKLDS